MVPPHTETNIARRPPRVVQFKSKVRFEEKTEADNQTNLSVTDSNAMTTITQDDLTAMESRIHGQNKKDMHSAISTALSALSSKNEEQTQATFLSRMEERWEKQETHINQSNAQMQVNMSIMKEMLEAVQALVQVARMPPNPTPHPALDTTTPSTQTEAPIAAQLKQPPAPAQSIINQPITQPPLTQPPRQDSDPLDDSSNASFQASVDNDGNHYDYENDDDESMRDDVFDSDAELETNTKRRPTRSKGQSPNAKRTLRDPGRGGRGRGGRHAPGRHTKPNRTSTNRYAPLATSNDAPSSSGSH